MAAAAVLLALLAVATPAAAQFLDRSDWEVFADSEQDSSREVALASNAIDGDPTGTWWHTKWDPEADSFPHQITVRWGDRKATVSGLRYTPRAAPNGRIGDYQIRVSFDGRRFPDVVAEGTWGDNSNAKTVRWPATTGVARVRLRCLSEAGGRGPWCNAADIQIFGSYEGGGGGGGGGGGAALPRAGWFAVPDSSQTRNGQSHPPCALRIGFLAGIYQQ